MATSTYVSCGICLKNGTNEVAIIWCQECESGLCGVCKYQHNISNKKNYHKITPVEELYQRAQVPIRSRNMQLGIAHKFDVAKADVPKPEICAFCLLPNKDFVFVDRAGFFTICNKDGSSQDRFSMNCQSITDIVSIDNSTIAVACRTAEHDCVCLVDIKNQMSCIKAKGSYFGLAHRKGILYLCDHDRGVIMLNHLDYTTSFFYRPGYNVNFKRGITLSKNNACVCNDETDEIILLDPQGHLIWKFVDKNVLFSPTHITSDANGNIYALGQDSCNLVFLSADGKQKRQLYGREDGIENVADIHYDTDNKRLIIANTFGNVIIYNCLHWQQMVKKISI